MTHTIIQTLLETLSSPQLLGVAAFCGALLATKRCDDDELGDDELESGFNFSKQDLQEYKELVEQTNRRITELVDELDSGDAEDAKESISELISCYFLRAARLQEEGEAESAVDDYAAAFARYAEYKENFEESLGLLKLVAAGRLNYGVLLNDAGELKEADEEYALAEEANQKLVEFGDREARLDLNGLRLNRASIAFEFGNHSYGLQTLDDVAEDLRHLADDPENKSAEVLYYLAKTYATKAGFLRSLLDENDLDSAEAREASETLKQGIEIYRNLVDGGNVQYRRDLADALVLYVTTTPTREKSDLESAEESLLEACNAYQHAIACGENDATVDLFDATIQRAKLLMTLERFPEAEKVYSAVLDTFESFANSEELPLLDGLADAYLNRAKLRKGKATPSVIIEDLTNALELQKMVAEELVESLKVDGEHEDCGCDCHDHEHGGDGCRCETERAFLLKHWANDNYKTLMECFYERINAYLEEQDAVKAATDCVAAEELSKAYHSVLKNGETLDDEIFAKIVALKDSLGDA